ncbi:NAD(P)/FAD-dependent oxidoreductase [Flagellimonas allohymeniacidonis]|uniref:NAD(P)/FAD-dependent oxidoreductase n=1 Tax=Flagellimonas allohymeniacidonis TaxID=2517819 RepID=A0A4Q8QFK1_9FLAO|nr:NAD(P)/FAD-dependent oxidoreductase [Allomuricauda hymeniacidonis]TAI47988.1 NAD(P)/FAD-dependent oxidoreductase [Allomuricauda hymeniacidonis]
MFDVIIAGGGAAGFYGAIQMAEHNPHLSIAILERGKTVLTKVKISGGGRCNVTQGEFSARELVSGYPRGEKELLGPFHRHGPADVVSFFEEKGVPLKIESDGRVFPKSNSSQTIIDCFLSETDRLGIQVICNSSVQNFRKNRESDSWELNTVNKKYAAKNLLLCTGSNSRIWKILKEMGHTIVPPVPSLFTFNIKDDRIDGIQGISVNAKVEVLPKKIFASEINVKLKSAKNRATVLEAEGPILITHWGLSGPAILKLSAWGARVLNAYKYQFRIKVNWVPEYSTESFEGLLRKVKEVEPKKTVSRSHVVDIPQRLWGKLILAAGINKASRWAEITNAQLQHLSKELTQCVFRVDGKSTFKEEFVTAGGVDLSEINFKTFESKLHPGLFFAGEIINVDGITGGYNFQNAWTGAFFAAKAIAERES